MQSIDGKDMPGVGGREDITCAASPVYRVLLAAALLGLARPAGPGHRTSRA